MQWESDWSNVLKFLLYYPSKQAYKTILYKRSYKAQLSFVENLYWRMNRFQCLQSVKRRCAFMKETM